MGQVLQSEDALARAVGWQFDRVNGVLRLDPTRFYYHGLWNILWWADDTFGPSCREVILDPRMGIREA